MSGGESDAVKFDYKIITIPNTSTISHGYYPTTTAPISNTYWYGNTIYKFKYQIQCPAKTCKTMNWMELDTITPCAKCGLKLKAVSEQADFEVEVSP